MKILFLSLVMLSACGDHFVTTTTGPAVATTVEIAPNVAVTADRANQLAIGELCSAVSLARGTSALDAKMAALRAKADFTPAEFGYISRGEVATGMTQRAGICALGGNRMKVVYVKNTTTVGHFVEEMTFKGTPPVVLITDNYVVTGVRR